jgi:GTPase
MAGAWISAFRLVATIVFHGGWCIDAFLLIPSKVITTRVHESSSSSSTDKSRSNLLEELQSTFDYDGRLPTIPNFRCGFVSIIGAPNMGKSTLLNALLQEDLSIATARPQTTRHAILGLLTTPSHQVCLVDTPGVIADPAYKLQEGMMEAVVSAVHDADILMVVTDLFSTPIPDDTLFRRIATSSKPVVVVINKIDLVDKVRSKSKYDDDDATKHKKLSVTPEQAVAIWRQLLPNAQIILPVTAANGPNDPGVVALRNLLTSSPPNTLSESLRNLGRPIPGMFRDGWGYDTEQPFLPLPLSPPLYDQEALTDRTERFIASELIRGTLFELLQQELPYCCEVRITDFKEKKTMDRISADIIVERESQKAIVIGTNGIKIKEIGTLARTKLEEFLQSKVYLELRVKVDKDWRRNEDRLKAFGYLS